MKNKKGGGKIIRYNNMQLKIHSEGLLGFMKSFPHNYLIKEQKNL